MATPENEPKVRDAIKGAPSGYFVVVPQAQEEGEARLSQFIASATKSWRIVLAATCVGAAVGVVSSLLIRDTFRAQAIVAPARDQPGAGGGIRGQLGGLAALAGVDI